MKGYTIQNSIDLLEKAVENGGGSGGASTATDVTYDNTTSGLTAENVQTAIDEVAASVSTNTGAISTLSGAIDTINSKSIKFGTPVNETLTEYLDAVSDTHTFVNGGLATIGCGFSGSSNAYIQFTINTLECAVQLVQGWYNRVMVPVNPGDVLTITALTAGASIQSIKVVPLEFVAPPAPAAPESNTRKKK